MVCFDALALDCALTSEGRIVRVNGADSASGTASFRVLHCLRDHLGSSCGLGFVEEAEKQYLCRLVPLWEY